MATVLSDTALAMGALVKPVSLAGCEIAGPISKRSDAIRGKIAKALAFYSGRALAAAAARRANGGKEPRTAGADPALRGRLQLQGSRLYLNAAGR